VTIKNTMTRANSSWLREELLHLLSVSATLSGLCITVVALMNAFAKEITTVSVVDDIFAICALLFLICMYLIFTALRMKNTHRLNSVVNLIDFLFLLAMTSMTLAGFVMVYTIW